MDTGLENPTPENECIVIDNGSCKCRVGWSSSNSPVLEFRNLIAKPRKDRKKDAAAECVTSPGFQVGNDIVNIEAVRLQLKTQFDRNVVTHFYNQEKVFDYIFANLNIDSESNVPHSILLTEAICNPNYCRQQMNELLFECYGVPALCYGIDSVLSYQRNLQNPDALILSFGYYTTHVIPVLDGRLQVDRVRRLNIGGYHIITYLYRLMQMKYPVHLNAITISRMEALVHQNSSVAMDYQQELQNWSQFDYYTEHVKKIQLPYTAPLQVSPLTLEQKVEKRRELARRLIESNSRRAREKNVADEQQLQLMSNIRELYTDGDTGKFQIALQQNKLTNLEDLDKLISTLRGRINQSKQKQLDSANTENSPPTPKEKVPIALKPPPQISLDKWISETKDKRSRILKSKEIRKARRQEIAKRHTPAAQERMRIISLLAQNDKGVDEFGIDDKDWDVYKVINRDNDSDSEIENEKLLECENILRQHDPKFEEAPLLLNDEAENYQLHFGVESIRAAEILFQPSIIGNPEAGLADLIDFVLKLFPSGEQQRLVDTVFMTGGCVKFPGLKERLTKEFLQMRPFQSTYSITEAQLPELDAWLGARDFSASPDFGSYLTTKKDYEEKGSEFFKTHRASNFYFPTPK